MKKLAELSRDQVNKKIVECGEKFSWVASYDGFCLTRGHYFNNSHSLHDVVSDKIPNLHTEQSADKQLTGKEHHQELR